VNSRPVTYTSLAVFALFLAAAASSAAGSAFDALPAHLSESGTPTKAELAVAERWQAAIVPGEDDKESAAAWLDQWLGTTLPFRLRVGGAEWQPAAQGWKFTREPAGQHATAVAQEQQVQWTHPASGLKLTWQLKRLADYPAVEWLIWLENTGSKDSPLIEGFRCLQLKMNRAQADKERGDPALRGLTPPPPRAQADMEGDGPISVARKSGESPDTRTFMVHGANGGRCLPDDLMAFSLPVPELGKQAGAVLDLLRQDFEKLEAGRSILHTPLVIGQKQFKHGVGTHSVSRLRIRSPKPIERFSAWIGVDLNERTKVGGGSIVFSVATDQAELFRSEVLRGGQEPKRIDVDAKATQTLLLNVDDAGDGPSFDHADWADATITLRGGEVLRLDDLARGRVDAVVLGSNYYSSNEHLPLFNIEGPEGRGVLVGLGWTGSWSAEITRRGNELTAEAGLPSTRFRLRPGEKVRMPRVLLVFWSGQRLHGHNMLRRVLYDHYLPRVQGGPHYPLVSVNLCFTHHGKGGFLEAANEKHVRSLLAPCRELGVEAFVIDAGWYPCKQWGDIMTTKDFRYDPAKYPHGFRSLAEDFRKAGMAFGLWFPPEALGSYAEPATQEKFLHIVGGFVKDHGITMYRQDAGILPSAKEPDRHGITEMQHIAGLYVMQDGIRKRFPELVMEGCCGGGRRIDLESLARFFWHQKSDKWFDTMSDHCGLHGANLFLPGGVVNVPTEATDDFGVWSSFGGQLCLAWHPLDKGFPMEKAKRQVALYKRVRPYLSGDYYPLTECSLDAPWLAYQFHGEGRGRAADRGGFILVFKRNASAGNSVRLHPRGIGPEDSYAAEFVGSQRRLRLTGAECAKGVPVSLEQTPAAELIHYTRP